LFGLSSKIKYLHHRARLTHEATLDINWWLKFARSWNQTSFFYEDTWIHSNSLELASDASDIGIGGCFKTKWFMKKLTEPQAKLSIAWRELYAVVTACKIWSKLLTGRLIKFHCDNTAVVSCINSGTSKCPLIMTLIRTLFFIAAYYNFDIRLSHIPGLINIGPDRLSRLNMKAFREHCPRADLLGTDAPDL
jgi:hypothetical protein